MSKLLLVVLVLCPFSKVFAGGIRTLYVNDENMQAIRLRMGRATVLRFPEKPKKIVIGNQNYYSVEFVDHDLTIQPLDDVETNLFVYTPYRTYGFILRTCHHCRYDDLIYVKWKSKFRKKKTPPKKSLPRPGTIGLGFDLGRGLRVTLLKVIKDERHLLQMVDLLLTNVGIGKKDIASFKLVASRKGVPLKRQGYVLEKEILKRGEDTKARLFLPLKQKGGITLHFFLKDRSAKLILGRRYFK